MYFVFINILFSDIMYWVVTIKVYEKIKQYIKDNYKYLLIILITFLLFNLDTNYIIYTPGSYIDTSDRIEVSNSLLKDGTLGMAYVSSIKGSPIFLALSYLNNNWDIVSKDDITYPDEDMDTEEKREKLNMEQSISSATIASFKELGLPYNIVNTRYIVSYIDNDNTEIEVFDEIKRVDGIEISSMEEIRSIIDSKDVNDTVTLEVLRDNNIINVTSSIESIDDRKVIGVSIIEINEVETTPTVNINMKNNESGPSGGLMMALGIYNALSDDDITKGKTIIGTGTIDSDGNVGEIGGVKYKLVGAIKSGADVFICPKENYEEANKIKEDNNYDITIISVSTLKEAIEELKKL